jgi:hypothetical protein
VQAVLVGHGEGAQGSEEFGDQEEDKEGGEGGCARLREEGVAVADDQADEGGGHGAVQHRRGQEDDAQDTHGAAAQFVGGEA